MADESEEFDGLEFAEERKSKALRLRKKDGTVKNYTLLEMMSDGVSAWMQYKATRVQFNKKGVPDIASTDLKGAQAKLISLCLFHDAVGTQPVSLREIQDTFPASALNGIFDYCEKMNGLNDEGVEQAKKV